MCSNVVLGSDSVTRHGIHGDNNFAVSSHCAFILDWIAADPVTVSDLLLIGGLSAFRPWPAPLRAGPPRGRRHRPYRKTEAAFQRNEISWASPGAAAAAIGGRRHRAPSPTRSLPFDVHQSATAAVTSRHVRHQERRWAGSINGGHLARSILTGTGGCAVDAGRSGHVPPAPLPDTDWQSAECRLRRRRQRTALPETTPADDPAAPGRPGLAQCHGRVTPDTWAEKIES